MKNGLLLWNIALTMLVAFLIIVHFTGKKKKSDVDAVAVVDHSKGGGQFKMAYFEMDSVAANFNLVKQLKTELTSREEAITTEIGNRSRALQQKYEFYQKKAQANNLSQEESDKASQEMKQMDEDIKNRKQQLDQEYNNFMMTKQNEIKSKIEAFIKDYNKTRNFSYVVSDDPGLFYFQDTAYNITTHVIKGLNTMYQGKKN